MKKKLFTLLMSIIIPSMAFGQASWQIVETQVEGDLVSVSFPDMQHGWILSAHGVLLSTENGGESWKVRHISSQFDFTSIYFSSPDHGCILGNGEGSSIWTTNDGADSWDLQSHPEADRLNEVFFIDEMKGWAVGIKDNMNYGLYTLDGGLNWTEAMDIFTMEAELFGVSFRDEMSGNVCGHAGAFFTSNNGGTSGWAMNISIPQLGVDLYGIHNWGMQTGCAVGTSGTALYTTNKWGDYIETTTNTDITLNGVDVGQSANKLWAVGEGGTIIHTPNYLFGWLKQPTGVTEDLKSIDMVDDNNGWAVGDQGIILHYSTGTSVEEDESLINCIYPNPTSGISHIGFYNNKSSKIILKICDIHGKEVALLLDEVLPPGEHSILFDGSDLAAGIYFCVLEANGCVHTTKLIKLI